MDESKQGPDQFGPSQRGVEMGVAVCTMIFALIIIAGSVQAGIGWAVEGPRAGFFPFYVGLAILFAGAVNLLHGRAESSEDRFASWHQLRQVMSVVLPTAVYVSIIPWIGIYLSSLFLIAFFMKRLGNYGWHKIAPIAIGVPLITFIVFERWFLVPLPKGPIEAWLGF
ncbi:MAG TPA: tripartite tricarboxylate transporter TctB family protein [Xanthobacteraceae bacterium]|nr:tripartite tricarboxylate transporter TctB family protein [Xanthobacteraceae bacterium]